MLIPFKSTWKYSYNQGDLGTGWRTFEFDDSAWPSGPAPIGWPTGEALPGGLAALSAANGTVIPGNPNTTQITTYYRIHFMFSGDPATTLLVVSNITDDGSVVYLNGTELGRVGMPTGDITATTGATRGEEAVDHGFELIQASDTDPLRGSPGDPQDNVLAVEIHSNGSGSSDGLWEGSLVARLVFGPEITDPLQPADVTVLEGRSTTLQVVANAAPTPTYQWYKDTVAITIANGFAVDATAATYTITNMSTAEVGAYFSRVTSADGQRSVDSRTAAVDIEGDFELPRALQAVWVTLTNLTVTFDEPINTGTLDPFFFQLAGPGVDPENPYAGNVVSINAQNTQLNVEFYDFQRDPNENYQLTISGVEDPYANAMEETTLDVAGPLLVLAYSAEWKYLQDGSDQGTAWFQPAFEDTAWPSGPGVFGQETAGPGAPPPTGIQQTDLQSRGEGGPVTIYFRTKFFLPAASLDDVLGVEINELIDDSVAYYLNGVLVRTARMPATWGFQTDGAGGAVGDAAYAGPFALTNFVVGENTIAAEVHQIGATSSDVVFGCQVSALLKRLPSGPPQINTQPLSLTVDEGGTASFSVSASGRLPLSYQWRKGGVAIGGETNDVLVLNGVCDPDEGTYSALVSNSEGSVPSLGATLTVNILDATEPTLLGAVGQTNLTEIRVLFSEGVDKTSAETPGNYTVELVGGGQLNVVGATNPTPAEVVLTTDARVATSNYRITVEAVTDDSCSKNPITTTTQPVLIPVPLLAYDFVWKYEQTGNTNLGTAWSEPAFNDAAWPSGPAAFGVEPALEDPAAVPPLRINTPLLLTYTDGVSITNTSQTLTYFFRTRFDKAQISGAGVAGLRVWALFDDGLVLYVNGAEAWRQGVSGTPPLPTALATSHEATAYEGPHDLFVNIPDGESVLAVEVHQQNATSSDVVLGLIVEGLVGEQAGLGPELNIVVLANGDVEVSWTAGPEWQLYEALGVEGPYGLSADQTSPVVIPKATVEARGDQFFQLRK